MKKSLPAILLMKDDILENGLRVHKITKHESQTAVETRRGIKFFDNFHRLKVTRNLGSTQV